jgi:uncharacterized protein
MDHELRPFWDRFMQYNWKLGLFLILIVCVPRFILVLNANETGNYSMIGFIMFISALVPFIFLNRYGRKQIGLRKTKKIHFIILAFILGIVGSLILYFIGEGLFGKSYENWYVYIGKSYNIPEGLIPQDKKILFITMATTGMIFSPIGEELFFRGIVHGSFAKSVGEVKASIIDSTSFAVTHISHFGLIFINNQWSFNLIPTIIWVLSMFLVSVLFFVLKKYSDSLWGAIICHSGFNLGMIYCIFYLL